MIKEYMKTSFLATLLLCTSALVAQNHLVSFGAHGGLDFLMPKSDQVTRAKLGGAGAFDIGYTYYKSTRSSGDWGIHTGFSVGYDANSSQLDLQQQYTIYDFQNNEMLYTTLGNLDVSFKRVYAEVPIMAAFRMNGFILQLGLKTQFAVWSSMAQDLKNPVIDAYYVPFDVHVINETNTGVVAQQDLQKTYKDVAPLFNLLLATRIGYEAKAGDKGRFGIAAYLDYNIWNNHNTKGQPLISVAPITDMINPAPEVTVNSAFTSLISRINPLQVGITLYYGLSFEK